MTSEVLVTTLIFDIAGIYRGAQGCQIAQLLGCTPLPGADQLARVGRRRLDQGEGPTRGKGSERLLQRAASGVSTAHCALHEVR